MEQPVLKLKNDNNSVKVLRPFKNPNKSISFNGTDVIEFQYNIHDLKDEITDIEKWFKSKEVSIVVDEVLEIAEKIEVQDETTDVVEDIEKPVKRQYKKRNKIENTD